MELLLTICVLEVGVNEILDSADESGQAGDNLLRARVSAGPVVL